VTVIALAAAGLGLASPPLQVRIVADGHSVYEITGPGITSRDDRVVEGDTDWFTK
jgi:hypothetical protein